MNIPKTLTSEDIRSFRLRVSKLRGRDWPLNCELLMALLPATEIADRATVLRRGRARKLSYGDLASMDLTGSANASIMLVQELYPGITHWHGGASLERKVVSPEGPCHFAFDVPGLMASGNGWTFPAAILDALLSVLAWKLDPHGADEGNDADLQARLDALCVGVGEDEEREGGNNA